MKTEIKFGLAVVVVGIIWVMVEHIAGLNTTNFEQGEMARTIFAFLPFPFLFLGMKAEKKRVGKMSFLSAWGTGSLISLTYSIGLSIWFWVYASFINPNFLQRAQAWETTKLLRRGLSGQALADAVKANSKMFDGSPFSYLMLFVSFFVMGVVGSGIIALFLKSKKSVD